MPSAIARLGRERSVATLAGRVFNLEGASSETRARAEAALLRANPRLSRAAGFRNGASVVVPRVSGLELSADVDRTAALAGRGLSDETGLRLRAALSRVEDSFAASAERRGEIAERLEDRAFVRSAQRALPEARDLIAATRARVAREEEEGARALSRFRAGIAAAEEAVEALRALADPDL